MCDLVGQLAGEHSAHSQNAASNCIGIAFWKIRTARNNVRKEEASIWGILSGVLQLVLRQRMINPVWLNDGYHRIIGFIVVWKVGGEGYDMCDTIKVKSGIRIVGIENRFAIVELE